MRNSCSRPFLWFYLLQLEVKYGLYSQCTAASYLCPSCIHLIVRKSLLLLFMSLSWVIPARCLSRERDPWSGIRQAAFAVGFGMNFWNSSIGTISLVLQSWFWRVRQLNPCCLGIDLICLFIGHVLNHGIVLFYSSLFSTDSFSDSGYSAKPSSMSSHPP